MNEDRSQTLTLGNRVVRIEPFSGRKAMRAFKLLRGLADGATPIAKEWDRFRREWVDENAVTLTRAEAYAQLGPEEFEGIPEEAWAGSDNKIRVTRKPPVAEQIANVFAKAYDLAENEMERLLALIAMTNEEVKERRGDLEDALDELREEIMDAPFDDLIELAVLGGEMVDDQYKRKAATLGGRLGNALKLVGIDLEAIRGRGQLDETDSEGADEEERTSSTERRTSSTDSPSPTDGPPTPPSTPTGASSSGSTTGSP